MDRLRAMTFIAGRYEGDYNFFLLCQNEQLNIRTFEFEKDDIVMLESNQRDEIQLSIK